MKKLDSKVEQAAIEDIAADDPPDPPTQKRKRSGKAKAIETSPAIASSSTAPPTTPLAPVSKKQKKSRKGKAAASSTAAASTSTATPGPADDDNMTSVHDDEEAAPPKKKQKAHRPFTEDQRGLLIEFVRKTGGYKNTTAWVAFCKANPIYSSKEWYNLLRSNAEQIYTAAGAAEKDLPYAPFTKEDDDKLIALVRSLGEFPRGARLKAFQAENPERTTDAWREHLKLHCDKILEAAGVEYAALPPPFTPAEDGKLVELIRNGGINRNGGWVQFATDNRERSLKAWQTRISTQGERLYAAAGVPFQRGVAIHFTSADDDLLVAMIRDGGIVEYGGWRKFAEAHPSHSDTAWADYLSRNADGIYSDAGVKRAPRVFPSPSVEEEEKLVKFVREGGPTTREGWIKFAAANPERTKAAWQFILNLRRQDIYAAAEVPYERPVLYFGFSEADDQAIIEFLRRGRNKGGWAAFADEHPEHTLSVWRGHVTRNASRLYQAAGVPYVRRTPPPVTAAQRARLVTFVAARHFGNRKVSWREFVKANPERSLQSWQGVLHRYAADIFAAAGITYNRRPVFSKFGDEDDNKLIAFLRNGDSMRQGWSQFCAENPERSQQGWESRLLSQAERLYAVAGVPLVRKGTEGAKGSDDATVAAGEPPLIFRALSPTGGTEHHTQSVASVSGHRAERGLDDVGEIYRRRVHQPFTPSDDAKIVNFLSESGLDVHEAILWFALKNTERTMSKWRAYFLKNYDRFMKEISRYTAQLVPKIPLDEPSVSEGIRAAFENLRLPLDATEIEADQAFTGLIELCEAEALPQVFDDPDDPAPVAAEAICMAYHQVIDYIRQRDSDEDIFEAADMESLDVYEDSEGELADISTGGDNFDGSQPQLIEPMYSCAYWDCHRELCRVCATRR